MKGSKTSLRKTEAKLWLVSFGNGMFCSASRHLWWKDWKRGYMLSRWCIEWWLFLVLFCDVLGSELLWNCIIKHYKDNCHKVVPFLLTLVMLFVRTMQKCASYAIGFDYWSIVLDWTISEALFIAWLVRALHLCCGGHDSNPE